MKNKTNKEISSFNWKIEDLEEEIEYINKEFHNLYNTKEEIKQILAKFKTRDMTRNFLRSFQRYLRSDDFYRIRIDYGSKGKMISERISNKFSKVKRKNKIGKGLGFN